LELWVDATLLTGALTKLAAEYPAQMVSQQRRDVARVAFNIGLVMAAARPRAAADLSICDIGGGVGLLSVGCAAVGFRRVILVDDFSDTINQEVGDSVFALHRRYGVEVHSRDVIAEGIDDICAGVDVVTSFDSMEHWHHSPKRLFRAVIRGLNPGGVFVLGVPNCVNMRKRITVPFGVGKWSPMQDWYEADVFRHHVREPDVADLRYIARDMGLVDVRITGRNWLGVCSPSPAVRIATTLMDYPLRLRPSLCSDLYLTGRRPGSESAR
jgi:SAM-dependent methyltransferase